MQTIFQAVGYFHTEAGPCTWTPVATFKTRAEAEAFVAENEEHGVTEVEETTCVDDYGFPLTRREWAEVFPARVRCQADEIAYVTADKAAKFRAYCKEMGANS